MKKMFLFLVAANSALSAFAQTQDTARKMTRMPYTRDSLLSHWVIDINALGGMLNQNFSVLNTANSYPVAVSTNLGKLSFTDGRSSGINANLGYFFDRKGHFGVGTGIMYLYQWGTASLDGYKVDYRAVDGHNDVYRQVITANQPIRESLKVHNLNIPIVLKYKTRVSQSVGIAADAGILLNFSTQNNYVTNASFDYEAIYKHVTGPEGNVYTVYDNSVDHSTADLVITKEQYLKTHPAGDVNSFFAYQRALGYNVGANQRPTNDRGTVNYKGGSLGLMFQPSVNYFLNDNVALNFGVYYIYQAFRRDAGNGTRLTNNVGDYNSALTNVTNTSAHNYGVNLGVRLLFAKLSDRDRDGVPDKTDVCPLNAGSPQFQGCPDKDNDGIVDSKDNCPDVYGIALFNGCPDSDNDGIVDANDACPFQAGPAMFRGCPDTDNDGVSDAEDRCPTVKGPMYNGGCPIDTPKATRPAIKHEHDLTEPILFDLGQSTIQDVSLPILTEAVIEMKYNESAFVIIDGHTDNIGGDDINDILSFKRANAVKRYMTMMGADPKRMMAVGHGSRQPIAPNTTEDGRAKNRRVIMSLRHHSTK